MSYPVRADGQLTRGQLRVVELLALGLQTGGIAARLHLSKETVGSHMTRALRETGAGTRAGLVHHCWRTGQLGDRNELLAQIEHLREPASDNDRDPEVSCIL